MTSDKSYRNLSEEVIVALIGNPNVGKSSLFNALTGLHQHTGNWTGKTVEVACGRYQYKGKRYVLVDLPGTYSLASVSEDEKVTVDFLKSGKADCVLVVGDATALERNMYLLLQTLSLSSSTVFCVNLLDEAHRKNIQINLNTLEKQLGIPVVGTSASLGQGLDVLKEKIRSCAEGFCLSNPVQVPQIEMHKKAEEITRTAVKEESHRYSEPADTYVLGKISGYCIMLTLLLLIFWLTINGANYISELLSGMFVIVGTKIRVVEYLFPEWLFGLLFDGIYQTVVNVIAVMLPPMMIFYPLFSFLEDLGYLPRAAYLTDHWFQKCGGCGKQALTMAMGFGCNTVGVTGCRIISSPKERLIAIVTNSLVPCNGRFSTIIIFITLFFTDSTLIGSCILLVFVIISVGINLISSWLIHKSITLRVKSHFVLELPPYRRPNLKKILICAFWDRSLHILGRAVLISCPAGALIWTLQNVTVGNVSLINRFSDILNPLGIMLGMNGAFLVGFILSFPANELLLPITVSIMQGKQMVASNMSGASAIMMQNGITRTSAICIILFLMFHWPCAMTCITIYKETKSWKWTVISVLLPLFIGIFSCLIVSFLSKFI